MNEKDIKFTNFSDSPEYVDIFNDENTSSLVNDNEGIMLGATCLGQVTCTLELCTKQVCADVCANQSSTPTEGTAFAFSIGISVYSKTLLGDSIYPIPYEATSSTWGRNLRAIYNGPNRYGLLNSGATYNFSLRNHNNTTLNKIYHYAPQVISVSESCASTISRVFSEMSTMPFTIISLDGHNPDHMKVDLKRAFYSKSRRTVDVHVYGTSSTMVSIDAAIRPMHYNSAMTKNSTINKDKVVKTKIGTIYRVYDSSDKTIIARNKNADTFVKSVNYVSDSSTFSSRPGFPFYIQTSANTVYITYERHGSVTGGGTVDLTSDAPVIPTQTSDFCLARLGDLSDSGKLSITAFNAMFSSSTDTNRNNMILTPLNYDNLTINQNSKDTVYQYVKPVMFYSGGSSDTSCCLRMYDISTFDKWMYVRQRKTSTATTSTNFDYWYYPSSNVVNNVDWTNNYSELNQYFTLVLAPYINISQ
jgi:hypothetical protein